MVFCNTNIIDDTLSHCVSHNPYFNRWFSAICFNHDRYLLQVMVTILILIDGFLQSILEKTAILVKNSHNPYFNRWFSAISKELIFAFSLLQSQSLF